MELLGSRSDILGFPAQKLNITEGKSGLRYHNPDPACRIAPDSTDQLGDELLPSS